MQTTQKLGRKQPLVLVVLIARLHRIGQFPLELRAGKLPKHIVTIRPDVARHQNEALAGIDLHFLRVHRIAFPAKLQ